MANVNSYPQVSDGLEAIIRKFSAHKATGLVMTKREVGVFVEGLEALYEGTRIIEMIADREQWNQNAKRDHLRGRRDALEAGIEDGTVTILPIVPRATAARQTVDWDGAA